MSRSDLIRELANSDARSLIADQQRRIARLEQDNTRLHRRQQTNQPTN